MDREYAILLYDLAIYYVDIYISLLLKYLEKVGIDLDNTYLIITSDHGEGFGEHGFFGHKTYLYDELLRVPLLICGPNVTSKKIDELVALIDIPPTILNLVGIKVPGTFLGRDLSPLLLGDSANEVRKYVISEVFSDQENILRFSLRTKYWKYILSFSKGELIEELYNLKMDPMENEDVKDRHKDLVKLFRSILMNHIAYIRRIKAKNFRGRRLMKLL